MGRRLFVGNLPLGVTDNDLDQLFAQHGRVESARVVKDQGSGQSRGFAFVEMKTDQEAQAAIMALSGKDFQGHALTVNEARPSPGWGGGRRQYNLPRRAWAHRGRSRPPG